MAVRRGVAVGGDRHLLPAAARRARRRARARDAVAHAGAVRPARGARARSSAAWRSCARSGPRRTGSTSRRPRDGGGRRARALARPPTPRPPTRSSGAATCVAAFAPHARWTSAATHADPPAAGHRRRRPAPAARPGSRRTARASATGTAACGCPSARTRRGSTTLLEEAGVHVACVDWTDVLGPGRRRSAAALAGRRRCSCRSTARRSSSSGSDDGYPSRGAVPRHAPR